MQIKLFMLRSNQIVYELELEIHKIKIVYLIKPA